MEKQNNSTLIMMLATHIFRSEIEKNVAERLEHPYKQDICGDEVDLKAINKELKKSEKRSVLKTTLYFLVTMTLVVAAVVDASTYSHWIETVVFPAYFIIFLIEWIYGLKAKRRIREILAEIDSARGTFASENASTTSETCKTNSNNIVIYGGYSPFLGAGIDLDSWSFPINLAEAGDTNKPIEQVTPSDMHAWIKSHLQKLNIPDIEICEQIFTNGKNASLFKELLPKGKSQKPLTHFSEASLAEKMFSNDNDMRHYTRVKIPMWDTQLTISMFFRLLVVNNNLFVESRFFLLMPLKKKYRQLTNLPAKRRKNELINGIVSAAITAPFKCALSTFNVFNLLIGNDISIDRMRKTWREELEDNRFYNYGWKTTLREQWASTTFESYFQQIDQDLNLKLLTNEFLDSVLTFLDSKNVSTERFKQTSTKIINEGVMISGGEVKTDSLAVGKSANIVTNAVNNAVNKVQGDKAA